MVRKVAFVLALFLIMLQPALALTSDIKVKTLPYHEVQLSTFDPDSVSFSLYESFKGESDEYGDILFTFNSAETTFGIVVYIKWNGETVANEKYAERYETGQPVFLEVAPEGARILETPEIENKPEINETIEEATNETAEETANETAELNDSQQGITGLVVSPEGLSDSAKRTAYIILISIISLAIIGMFFFRLRRKIKKINGTDFKPTSLASREQPDIQLITDLESKIKNAQKELNLLKNQSKIKEAEQKLKRDQEELERLRKGDD